MLRIQAAGQNSTVKGFNVQSPLGRLYGTAVVLRKCDRTSSEHIWLAAIPSPNLVLNQNVTYISVDWNTD